MTSDEARDELLEKHGWISTTLDVWLRANGQCEYCKTDLLGSAGLYFRGGHIDHIAPDGGDAFDNLALACAVCNFLKRRFVPRPEPGSESRRSELIAAAANHIGQLRARDEGRLREARPLLELCGVTRSEGTGPVT